DAQVEIARNAAALSGAALAGEPHAGARLHAGRDLHLEPGRLGRAGLLQHDLALRAEDGIAQVHLDGSLDVVAGERLVARAPPAAAPTAEQIAEHRAEVGRAEARAARTASSEEVFESLEAAPSRAGARRLPVLAELARLGFVETAAQRDLAKLVEEGALLGIAHHVEGSGDVLEALLRLLVPGVHVGVELLRQLPVCLLDLHGAGGARDTERGIGVLHGAAYRNHPRRVGQRAPEFDALTGDPPDR